MTIVKVNYLIVRNAGNSEYSPTLISTICLGVLLLICFIGLITVIALLIKSKAKGTLDVAVIQSRKASIPLHTHIINTEENIAYVVHTPKTNTNAIVNDD
jgi:hypothetical protein